MARTLLSEAIIAREIEFAIKHRTGHHPQVVQRYDCHDDKDYFDFSVKDHATSVVVEGHDRLMSVDDLSDKVLLPQLRKTFDHLGYADWD